MAKIQRQHFQARVRELPKLRGALQRHLRRANCIENGRLDDDAPGVAERRFKCIVMADLRDGGIGEKLPEKSIEHVGGHVGAGLMRHGDHDRRLLRHRQAHGADVALRRVKGGLVFISVLWVGRGLVVKADPGAAADVVAHLPDIRHTAVLRIHTAPPSP